MAPPFAAPEGFLDAASGEGKKQEQWYLFQEGKELILTSNDGKSLPSNPIKVKRSLFVGTIGNTYLFAGEVDLEFVPPGWEWKTLRSLFGVISDQCFAIAGRAMQLLEWDRIHQYCGCCGSSTSRQTKERSRKCTSCSQLFFPKIAPVVMALIKKGKDILLARGVNFPERFYSVLAGFVNPGETLEQCVLREVLEEVGIEVQNIRYFGSQPWPFSCSLMIGFTCEWKSGDIEIDPVEIAEASWFNQSNLPQIPPSISLARMMIDAHFKN
jgi:NAD+ diphosphatase